MIARTATLALVGCIAALCSLRFAMVGPGPETSTPRFFEMPLAAVPLIESGRVSGLSFVRFGVVGDALDGLDGKMVETFLADALYQGTLGEPEGVHAASRTVDPARLKVAVPIRLERAEAPFALERIVVVQSEFRALAQLRELSAKNDLAARP